MPSGLRCLFAFVLLFARQAHALPTMPVGVELWRVPLDAALAAQPAVSESGLIAIATEKGVRVLRPDGSLAWSVPDAQLPFQPMWAGDRLWYRTKDGWRWRMDEQTGPVCRAGVQSGAVDDEGRAVFALDGELIACGDERKVLARRRAREGQVWPLPDGWATADEWAIELFAKDGVRRASLLVTDVGYPGGVTPKGELLVMTVSGRLDLLDSKGNVVWQGPLGGDGPPVFQRGGAFVLSGGREVRLIDPPHTVWSLPVAAGARAIAALEGGAVALLERTGHLGIVREGRLVWSRTLVDPGNVLGAHPQGFLLVQDNGALVAISAPAPDVSSAYPVAGGLARNGRAQLASTAARCPLPPPPALSHDLLHVDGPAFVQDDVCLFPSVELACAKGRCQKAPAVRARVACGASCEATVASGEVAITEGTTVRRYDASGKLRGKQAAPKTDAAWVASARQGGATAALTRDGALVVTGAEKPASVALSKEQGDRAAQVVWFGQTACAASESVAGCVANGKLAPALSLAPRSAWFGDAVFGCQGNHAICLQGRAAEEFVLAHTDGEIDALLPLGDGSLAVLVADKLLALWPSGEVRWSVAIGKLSACAGRRWMSRLGPDTLVVRGCGEVAWLSLAK